MTPLADLFPPEPAMGDWHHDWAAIDEPPQSLPDDVSENGELT